MRSGVLCFHLLNEFESCVEMLLFLGAGATPRLKLGFEASNLVSGACGKCNNALESFSI